MKTFNDNAGRTWTVAINVDAIKRVKSLLGINLLEAVEGKLIEQLVSDPVMLCDVLYVLCKPEADAKQVSDEDFGRSMAGDAIDHGTTCLLEELVDFFRSRGRGNDGCRPAPGRAPQARQTGYRRQARPAWPCL